MTGEEANRRSTNVAHTNTNVQQSFRKRSPAERAFLRRAGRPERFKGNARSSRPYFPRDPRPGIAAAPRGLKSGEGLLALARVAPCGIVVPPGARALDTLPSGSAYRLCVSWGLLMVLLCGRFRAPQVPLVAHLGSGLRGWHNPGMPTNP